LELGRDKVFSLQTAEEKKVAGEKMESSVSSCPILFGPNIEYSCLTKALRDGWSIHTTPLTNTFTFSDIAGINGGQAIPLFAVQPTGEIEIFTTREQPEPQSGWTVISLVPPVGRGGPVFLTTGLTSPCRES
jgi:hypothetical protein